MLRRLTIAVSKVEALLTPGRITIYALAMLIIVYALYGRVLAERSPADPIVVDYGAHLIGGRMALDGRLHALYDLQQQRAVHRQILPDARILPIFVSPPFVAYFYAPFAALPHNLGAIAWTLLTLVLLVASLRLIWPLVPNLHRLSFARIMLVSLSSAPVFALLSDGQDAAISLFLLALGLQLLLSGHDLLGGTILAFGVFKPHFFLLLPLLLLLQRRWQALAAWAVVAALLTGVSLAMVGLNGAYAYVALLNSDLYHQSFDIGQAWMMISLLALVRSVGWPALAPVAGTVAGVILAAAFGPLAASRTGRREFILLYTTTILISVLVAPHALVYDGVVLFIPALILLDDPLALPGVRAALALGFILLWLFSLHHETLGVVPWTVIPIVVLLFAARRLLNEPKMLAARAGPSSQLERLMV